MKIESIKFNAGQAVAVNTYLNVIANSFEWLFTHGRGRCLADSFFADVVTLMTESTMDKTDLANEIVREFTDDYHDQKGAYMKADVKEAGFGEDVFDWLVRMHNQAIETVKTLKSFGGVSVSVIK